MRFSLFLIFMSLLFPLSAENPFLISYFVTHPLQPEDYQLVQDRLRALSPIQSLDELYPKHVPFTWPWQKKTLQQKEDFQGRIHRGIHQTLIDLPSGKIPESKLQQINAGGDCCIVCYSSFDGIYPELLAKIPDALTKTGFNGYFLSLLGAFPCPTGEEIRYAGVPYSFKIFAMLEAKKRGFQKVLWIDAALLPLQDPSPLFDWIEKSGCLFQRIKNGKRYLLPATRDVLLQETGSDMYVEKSLRARVIGLYFNNDPKVDQFIKEYYALVALGTPFLSCLPDEFVLGSLAAKDKALWPDQPFSKLVLNERKLQGKSVTSIKEEGFFFLLQNH